MGIAADVTEIARILIGEEAMFADLQFAEIIDVYGEVMDVFCLFSDQIERQADGLAGSDGGQVRELVRNILDRFRKLHHVGILACLERFAEPREASFLRAKKDGILRFAQNDHEG